jgi:hypothetical protein
MTPRAQFATGFFATIAVLVPSAWHILGADIERDGKHMRPLQQKVTIDGAVIALDVDRSVVMTGDTVTATLVATSDAPKDVVVDLRALHTQNYSGERVERPWQQIDRETITLHAAPGGGTPVKTKLKLGERPAELALADSFRVMVTRHGAKPAIHEFDGVNAPDYDALQGEDGTLAAAVFVRGWSGNSLGIQIVPKGPVTGDAPFTVAVTIKNTSGHKLEHAPWIELTTDDALTAADDSSQPALEIERAEGPADGQPDADPSPAEPTPVKKNGTVTQLFTVTPHRKLTGKLAFLATATENEGLGPYGAGAMDIRTFDVAEAQPSVAVK